MQIHIFLTAALAASLLLAGCAVAPQNAPARMEGDVLVNSSRLTLYTYDKDQAGSGRSACNGDCAVKWPPHLVESGQRAFAPYSIVTRDEGRQQWAYQGKPLYTWPEDQEPGDKYGDGYNKVWHVITPAGVRSASSGANDAEGY